MPALPGRRWDSSTSRPSSVDHCLRLLLSRKEVLAVFRRRTRDSIRACLFNIYRFGGTDRSKQSRATSRGRPYIRSRHPGRRIGQVHHVGETRQEAGVGHDSFADARDCQSYLDDCHRDMTARYTCSVPVAARGMVGDVGEGVEDEVLGRVDDLGRVGGGDCLGRRASGRWPGPSRT